MDSDPVFWPAVALTFAAAVLVAAILVWIAIADPDGWHTSRGALPSSDRLLIDKDVELETILP